MLTRRHFLKNACAVALGFLGLHKFIARANTDFLDTQTFSDRVGSLIPDPKEILDLPKGFSYRIISRTGAQMSDGYYVPALPDGMAAFPGPKNLTLLIRNHEIDSSAPATQGAFGEHNLLLKRLNPDLLYDGGSNGTPCLGGTTTIVYDTRNQRVERQFLSLAGTLRNCAGGPTPWNSWITCEETVERARGILSKDHGYNFEVPATVEAFIAKPLPLKAMGRFRHEAVAVEPATGIVYQTEDVDDGLIYRFLPNKRGRLGEGGRLQALSILDRPGLDTRNWLEERVPAGAILRVGWIDLDNVESPNDDLRYRGFKLGAARFASAEGMWYGKGAVYFACTNGGRKKKGQIWRYLPSPHEGTLDEGKEFGRLELFIEPNDGSIMDNADSLTVAPWGDLIVCEDGSGEQFLLGVTPQGDIYRLARNATNNSEFAGATFAPDGSTLFVNLQAAGLTLAITGPWKS